MKTIFDMQPVLSISKCMTSCELPQSLTEVSYVSTSAIYDEHVIFPQSFEGFHMRPFRVVTKTVSMSFLFSIMFCILHPIF